MKPGRKPRSTTMSSPPVKQRKNDNFSTSNNYKNFSQFPKEADDDGDSRCCCSCWVCRDTKNLEDIKKIIQRGNFRLPTIIGFEQ